MKNIAFSPVDISKKEIKNIVKTLRSGWITTGAVTKEFEKKISVYCNTEKTVCLNSATVCLDLILKIFEITKGDEIITTSYTFASTANSIIHTGAKIVFVDLKENEFNIAPELLEKAITKRTKAVITTDIGGFPVDYDRIKQVLSTKKKLYSPKKNTLQSKITSPLYISDAAHSFGAYYKNKKIGSQADFTFFSFHATKNLTTAEGGAITFNKIADIDAEYLYKQFMLLSLHGQSKDAFTKLKAGGWRYNIELPGYKCNLTDIASSLGLAQLERYEKEILPKRKALYNYYNECFYGDNRFILPPFKDPYKESSYHLFPLRIKDCSEEKRDQIIAKMASKGIALNVHFIPIVMQSYYKKIGYDIKKLPNTYNMFKNEISLPFSSLYNRKTAIYVSNELKKCI